VAGSPDPVSDAEARLGVVLTVEEFVVLYGSRTAVDGKPSRPGVSALLSFGQRFAITVDHRGIS